MRVTSLLTKTLREVPSDADTASHQLMVRAGLIHQLVAGVYSYLPLGWRALQKIEDIVRDEMNKAGAQEVLMPVLHPAELWGDRMGDIRFTLYDRRERQLTLGPTHEEVATQLVARYVQSYRDLPLNLYQIQTKFRDEPRPRGGLIRAREFSMKDAYSFDINETGLDIAYNKMLRAYQNIYDRCGLSVIVVDADSGPIGGKDSREFIVTTPTGEDEVIFCTKCKYAANREKAVSVKEKINGDKPLPLEPVDTPGTKSIEEVADFLHMSPSHTLKAVFYIADGVFVFGVIRGDLEVNETKLRNHLRCIDLRLATEDEVIAAGIVPGFASPIGLKGVKIIADDSVSSGVNYVAGGNKPDTHFVHVNYPRDFKADIVADIAAARAGDECIECGEELASTRGIEVGHIFKLGTIYSSKLGADYLDKDGESRPIVMGCYGLGPSRLLAAAVEQLHDDKGIIWPVSIAPYQVYLCPLYRPGSDVLEVSEQLYKDFEAAGIEVLFDDREESPGVKFNDADLIGLPFRVTVSPRTLEKNSVEIKRRSKEEPEIMTLGAIVERLKFLIKR